MFSALSQGAKRNMSLGICYVCMKAYQNPWCISVAGVIGSSIFLSLPYSLAFDYSLVLHNILSLEFLHLMNSQSILSFYSILAHFIPVIKFLFIEQVLSCSKSYFFYQIVNSLKSGTSYSLLIHFYTSWTSPRISCTRR